MAATDPCCGQVWFRGERLVKSDKRFVIALAFEEDIATTKPSLRKPVVSAQGFVIGGNSVIVTLEFEEGIDQAEPQRGRGSRQVICHKRQDSRSA